MNWRIIICWIFGHEFDRRYPDCYRCGKLR
jgi:hypothetical protein